MAVLYNFLHCRAHTHIPEHEEHNISENPEYIDYLKNKGFQAVPVLEENDFPIVNGFRPDLLKKLIAQ